MKKWTKAGLTAGITVALCASFGVTSAFAATRTVQVGGDGADWTVPTTPMTNTVWKDADGNVVAANTEGATQYKVMTNWAEAWSTCGADFLGISNSAYYGNGGNGNATVTDYATAKTKTTVAVWATSANVNPNAYNWNTFYNLYQTYIGGDAEDMTSWSTATSGNNKDPRGGANWSTEAGVWCGFKYRPDIVTTNNNLSASAAATYIAQIKNKQYSATATAHTEGTGREAVTTYIPDAAEDGTYDQSYYSYGDENYNPSIFGYNNNSAYAFSNSLYTLASLSDQVIAKNGTTNADGTAVTPGLSDGEELTWTSVNKLPRETRYTETATQCALNFEKLMKGSIYYALEEINAGNVDKKTVALVNSSTDPNGTSTAAGTVLVTAYDYIEGIGGSNTDGICSIMPAAVNQLTTNTPSGNKQGSSAVASTDTSTNTYQAYVATADELLSSDVIYAPESSVDETTWREWLAQYATTDELKAKAQTIKIVLGMPCATGGSNFTIEKCMYGAYALDNVYPELFPNMELSTFWCDAIYHLTSDALPSAMSWIYASGTLADGADLNSLGTDYSREATVAKFNKGYQYFKSAKTTDATLYRITNNIGLDGLTATTVNGTSFANEFSNFEPSDVWVASMGGYNITEQPKDVTDATVGEKYTFSVASNDANATYQWYYSSNGKTWAKSKLTGSTTNTLTVTASATSMARSYKCVVTYSDGTTEDSEVATFVGEKEESAITAQPAKSEATVGETATFSITATNAYSYQWQYSNDNGKTWHNSNVSGCTTASMNYKVTEANVNRVFRCVVKFNDGSTATSESAWVVLKASCTQPVQTLVSGSKYTLSVEATYVASYQWQYTRNGGLTKANSGYTGAKSNTLTVNVNEANKDRQYRCVVTYKDGTTFETDWTAIVPD